MAYEVHLEKATTADDLAMAVAQRLQRVPVERVVSISHAVDRDSAESGELGASYTALIVLQKAGR
jgi:hypothetical protein